VFTQILAQGNGKFFKLASININKFRITSVDDGDLQFSLELKNNDNKKIGGLKYGFIFKDSKNEVVIKKIMPDIVTLNPGQKIKLTHTISPKFLVDIQKVSAVILSERGLYLGMATISGVPEKFPGYFDKNSKIAKSRYECKIESNLIYCNENRKGNSNVKANIVIYKKTAFGKRVFEEDVSLERKDG
jgi:hypothetical protein